MATPTRSARSGRTASGAPAVDVTESPPAPPGVDPERQPDDPDGGHGDIHTLLTEAVDEAARLLDADGAMVYLLDPQTNQLRFAHDAGIQSERSRAWVRSIHLPVGVGMFGQAVQSRSVVTTGNYLDDPSFDHAEAPDRVVRDIGIRSMVVAPLAAGDDVFGALGTFTSRPDGFTPAQIALVRALADHAAASMRNVRLIEALDGSRRELAERADAERTLREIAARVSSMRDQGEILQSVIDASIRLLGASSAIIHLLGDAGTAEAWKNQQVEERIAAATRRDVTLDPDAGVSRWAVRDRRAVWTGDYFADDRFEHAPVSDAFIRDAGIVSVVAAPLIHRDSVVGVITVDSERADAFDEADAALLTALADQAGLAIANARLIDELERSRSEIARTADAERTLREIAARVSAILDPAEVLQRIVDETTRLLESDGARIDLYDPAIDALRWAYAAGDAMSVVPEWATSGGLKPGQAVAGTAFAEQRPVRTDDYLADERFLRDDAARAFVKQTGIRSVIAVPLAGDGEPLGTLSVASRRAAAYDAADMEVLAAFATQASIAIRNARLIDELARSRAVIERRATAEQALREIGARITAIREPGDLLQRIVDEARRLLRADGAVIDEFDPVEGVLVAAYDAGLSEEQRISVRSTRLHVGEGLAGKAMAERRVIAAGDYLAGDFVHTEKTDELALRTDIGDLAVAPIIGDEGPLGAIEVYSRERHSFDEIDEAILGGLADQAAIAITNARLIAELERSQAAVARRADTERALREITARIAALREPDVILKRVVEEAKRLLGSDGAHLTRMAEGGTFLVPMVVAGAGAGADQSWLMEIKFPLDGGINGLAAERVEPIWTYDYLSDPRIPHDDDDVAVAERLGLRGMAAAPLRAPGGEVIGTLAVSTAQPRAFAAEELDLLQGLADQAAIAITNSTLLTRLTESEGRYRYLVERAPDLVWSIGADARLTFLSDAVVRLTGRQPDELLGQHFGALVHESSRDVAEFDWTSGMRAGSQEVRGRVNLAGADGTAIPAEFIATARLDDEGRFLGANGSVRDMREQERLENELRGSEARYRFLVENSPDVVFSTDAEGLFTFMSDSMERMTGWRPDQLVGAHFSTVIDSASLEVAVARWTALMADPATEQIVHMNLVRSDGDGLVPVEVSAIGMLGEDGAFAGIHGATRDISERARLERELRRQAGELAAGEERAHLARELHDSVTQALFSMTLVTRSVEMVLDRDIAAARTHLTQLRDLQREALAEMRALIFELRPGNLEQDGLTHALRTHTAAIQGRIGLPVVVESALQDRLPLAVEEVLYRIAQEALHNVIKHAGARQVRVEIGPATGGVRLRIADDGKGFDPRQVPDGHLGLAGMQARADRIGAAFTCRSLVGEGTTIEVLVPETAIAAAGLPPGPVESSAIRDE